MCLDRIGGVPTCRLVYNRLCFARAEFISDCVELVKAGEDYVPEEKEEVVVMEPSTFIQKLFVDVVKIIVADLGEVMPHEKDTHPNDPSIKEPRVYIPSGLASNILDLVRLLVNKGLLTENISEGTMHYLAYKVFPKFFWNVRIKKWIPFARCDKCVTFFNDIMACKTNEERHAVKELRGHHIDACTLFRRRHELRMELGHHLPNMFMSLVIDGMDNQKTQIPRLEGALYSKTLDNAGHYLATKLEGVIVHGLMYYGGWEVPYYEGGSSLIITILMRVITLVFEHKGVLPPVLLIQADNCGRENKNQYMVGFLGWLIEQGYFCEARMYFLVVGHTHCIADQHFSRIHAKIQGGDFLTLEEMMYYVQKMFEEYEIRVQEQVTDIGDWQDFFKDTLRPLHGLGTARRAGYQGRSIHCIRVIMGPDKRAAFQYKEHDTCFEPWQGHWSTQRPLTIFKSGATHPNIIKAHARHPIENLDLVEVKIKKLLNVLGDKMGGSSVEEGEVAQTAVVWSKESVKNVETVRRTWQNFFQEQRSFFDGKDVSNPEQCRPNGGKLDFIHPIMQQSMKRSDSSSPYPNTAERERQQLLYTEACVYLDWLDDTIVREATKQPELSTFPSKIKEGIGKVLVYEKKVGGLLRQDYLNRPLSVYHASDRLSNKEVYDPVVHLMLGDVALLDMSKGRENCINGGVEIARVVRVFDHPLQQGVKMMDVEYLRPNIVQIDSAKNEYAQEWPDEWVNSKLVAWKIRNPRTKRLELWSDTVEVSAVCWSCTLAASGFLRKAGRHNEIMFVQYKRLQEFIRDRPPGASGFHTDQTVFEDSLPDDG